MAINFTVSYSFSPNTTIASSQVNTNFSDNAAVWVGLEAKTKSFSALQVDATPSVAADVVRKDYVDHLMTWRRPVLQFGSVTTIAVESGLDGTSGDIPMLFPDGTFRTETSTTRTTFDITRNAVLTTSGAQSGLRTSLSEATNTWYALYAVKVTDSSTLWCTVGDTRLPLQANFANLNTAFGTNGWVYLGLVRNGDNSGATGDLLNFKQSGNVTIFNNAVTGSAVNSTGLRLATTAGATSLTYTYSTGTGTTDIPNNISIILPLWQAGGGGSSTTDIQNPNNSAFMLSHIGTNRVVSCRWIAVQDNKITNGSSISMDIMLIGFIDGALGVGANPLL